MVVRSPPLMAAPPLISVPSAGPQLLVAIWLVVAVMGPFTSWKRTVTVTALVSMPGWLQIA